MRTTKQIKREARQLLRLCLTDGVFDEGRAQQLVQRVFQEKPRGYLPVLEHFQRLVRLESALHAAKVETATPLPPELRPGIEARLAGVYGPGLKVSFEHTPALLGGMCVTVGSDVYDGSVRARLAALEQRF
jgi:F-type H+-transporting ATPase subunit delta